MSCDNKEKNGNNCPCTYSCANHGKCCECIAYHQPNEFPACFFSKEAERTYDRSFNALLRDRKGK